MTKAKTDTIDYAAARKWTDDVLAKLGGTKKAAPQTKKVTADCGPEDGDDVDLCCQKLLRVHCILFRLSLDLHEECHGDTTCSTERHEAIHKLVLDAGEAVRCAVCTCQCCSAADPAMKAGKVGAMDWAALLAILIPLLEAWLKPKPKTAAKAYAETKQGASECCCDLILVDGQLLGDVGKLHAACVTDGTAQEVLDKIECCRAHVLCSLDLASRIHCETCAAA